MALSALKTWIANEVLTASDLNGMNTNILNNALSLISPLTGNLDVNNNQLTNAKFEIQSATQSATIQEGRAYWQSTEDLLHIGTGTLIARVPALTGIQQGRLVGITNPTGVAGATTYSQIELGSGLSLSGTTLSGTTAAILQVQVFS